jgi:phospholipid/cholesterol/gamma-HCH transport system permease protein
MATADTPRAGLIMSLGAVTQHALVVLGDFAIFAGRSIGWIFRRRPASHTLYPNFYIVGVRSVPVVAITGMFIGMVMAVQMYHQFHRMGMATRLGAMINITIVRELGPVLAATMLAGRVGSAMAAELASMRVTEQIDALSCLGTDPVHYLVVPRFVACLLLIPLLTVIADAMGVLGGGVLCLSVYGIEPHHYFQHSREMVRMFDVFVGLIKSVAFGGVIALIACHRGFRGRPGAEGVGRAATEAFVASFVAILAIDFFLALLLNALQERFQL